MNLRYMMLIYFHSPLSTCKIDSLTSIVCSPRRSHITLTPLNHANQQTIRICCTLSTLLNKNERILQIDKSCVLIWLFFLDSNHLNCQDNTTRDDNAKLTTISEVHVCLYLHWHYKLYHPLESERYSSTFIIFYSRNLTATCCLNLWLTCQLLTDSIGTLSKWYHSVHSYHMCAHTCISPTHTLTYYILVEINRVNWISLGLTCKE